MEYLAIFFLCHLKLNNFDALSSRMMKKKYRVVFMQPRIEKRRADKITFCRYFILLTLSFILLLGLDVLTPYLVICDSHVCDQLGGFACGFVCNDTTHKDVDIGSPVPVLLTTLFC
jgi:hypothetical protein